MYFIGYFLIVPLQLFLALYFIHKYPNIEKEPQNIGCLQIILIIFLNLFIGIFLGLLMTSIFSVFRISIKISDYFFYPLSLLFFIFIPFLTSKLFK